jgi:hypothetical protein
LRGVQEQEFVWVEEAFGPDHRDYVLVDGGQAAIPVALFVAKRLRKGLEAGHAGHFLDTVYQESGARPTQDEDQRGVRRREAEVEGAVDDIERMLAALNYVADFTDLGTGNFPRGTGERVDATDFLNRRGGNGKQVPADTKQDDLLRAERLGLRWSRAHYFTPTGVALQMPITRFSITA